MMSQREKGSSWRVYCRGNLSHRGIIKRKVSNQRFHDIYGRPLFKIALKLKLSFIVSLIIQGNSYKNFVVHQENCSIHFKCFSSEMVWEALILCKTKKVS